MVAHIDRLVMRWQDSDDADEKDVLFARIIRHCMRLPVVRRARRQTFTRVASHSPRWADEEEQAIRTAIWRAAKRWDRSRGVAFDAYASRGLGVALHDFWRRDTWVNDLALYVPMRDWQRFRQLMASRPSDMSGRPDECPVDLYLACTVVPAEKDEVSLAVWDDYDEEVL